MNTCINYLYRDANNYKMQNFCIIDGEITPNQIAEIRACLDEGKYFIPHQVGLPERRFDKNDSQSDHCWFELSEIGFELTDEPSDLRLTVEQLVENFQRAKNCWNDRRMEEEGRL